MRILGIETSCDETAIAVIEMSPSSRSGQAASIKILSSIVLSQIPFHRKFGGVVPNLAKREHQRNLVPLLLRTLKEAGLLKSKPNNKKTLQAISHKLQAILEREPELLEQVKKRLVKLQPPKIDAIAVTVGPGLEPALWAGVNFVKALSFLWKKTLIPVNHLEGHIYTVMLGNRPTPKQMFQLRQLKLPALVLIVSGGHTELVLIKKPGSYSVIGETRDDAAGEAFDKVARLLGLKYPGGPEVAAYAERAENKKLKVSLPRPMISSPDFDFSFSGLKTAVLYLLQDLQKKHSLKDLRGPVSKEFQNAVVEVLVAKTMRAAKKFKVKSVIVGGGVAANKLLRETLEKKMRHQLPSATLRLPAISLTGDNALMIALAAYFSKKKKHRNQLRASANLRLDRK